MENVKSKAFYSPFQIYQLFDVFLVGNIVAVDSVSPTVFCIAESGELIKWFDCSDYMREPSDIAINAKDYFVCDFKVSYNQGWDCSGFNRNSGFSTFVRTIFLNRREPA